MSVDFAELIKQLQEEVDSACISEEEECRTEIESLSALRESVERYFANQEDAYSKLAECIAQSIQVQAEDRAQTLAGARSQGGPDLSAQVIQGLDLLGRRLDSLAAQFGVAGLASSPKESEDPALDSVMSQFDLLQQDLARRNGEVP